MKIRVGFGFDVHRLIEGRELWAGEDQAGARIRIVRGHCSADVLIHAILRIVGEKQVYVISVIIFLTMPVS